MEPGWSRTGMTPTNRNEILEGIMYTDIESQYGTGMNSFRNDSYRQEWDFRRNHVHRYREWDFRTGIMYVPDIESYQYGTGILEGIMYTDIDSQYRTGMRFIPEWLLPTGIMILEGIMYTDIESQYGTGMNSFRNDSYRQEWDFRRNHVHRYRVSVWNRDELIPEWLLPTGMRF